MTTWQAKKTFAIIFLKKYPGTLWASRLSFFRPSVKFDPMGFWRKNLLQICFVTIYPCFLYQMFHFNIQAPWRMCHVAHYSKTSPLVTYWHLSLARPLRHHFSYRFQEFPKRIEAADGPRQFPLVVPSLRGRGHAVQVIQTLCLEHLSAQYPVGFWGNSAPLSKHDACGETSSRWGEAAGETVQVFCNSMMLNSISLFKVNFSFELTHHQGSRAFWKCEITG